MDQSFAAFDSIVIGGGPSGLFCALGLAEQGERVALVDRGGLIRQSLCPEICADPTCPGLDRADDERADCPRCHCLHGLGGAAFHFDCNLGYVRRLSHSKIERGADGSVVTYSRLERALGGYDRASALVEEVYRRLDDYGLSQDPATLDAGEVSGGSDAGFSHIDTEVSEYITLDRAVGLVETIQDRLVDHGVEMLVRTTAEEIDPTGDGRWRVQVRCQDRGPLCLEARAVIVGVGKSALPWVMKLLERLGIDFEETTAVDLGVRIETLRDDFASVTRGCHNPKLSLLSARGESVRTFCVCDGGRVMQYRMAGVTILDGQHCIRRPTPQTNFGVLTTTAVPAGLGGTDYALAFARRVNEMGRQHPVVQRVGDFVAGRPTLSLEGNAVQPSLLRYALGNLAEVLPGFLREDITSMIDHLNRLAPGCVQPYSLIVAPVVERLFPRIRLGSDFQSSRPGIFFVGDCSNKVMGIIAGAVTGLQAARAIVGD
jgi:uncharacterized FAD-dependent dehydrogenase